MKKRNSFFARILAVVALAAAIVVVVVIVSAGLKKTPTRARKHGANHPAKQEQAKPPDHGQVLHGQERRHPDRRSPTRPGIPVAEILTLNPEVDPQILIAGEKLKLR